MTNQAVHTPEPSRTAVLLINTGSPEAPTAPAVRDYLAQFLSDRRVVELPPLRWLPILHGIILRTRPAKSAARYRGVWTDQGSPLIVHTRRTAEALGRRLEGVRVAWAMCYGKPSVESVVRELVESGVERLLVLPMFAQYAAQTNAAACDAVFRALMKERRVPALRVVRGYHREPAYVRALVRHIEDFWTREGRPFDAGGGKLMISFHGIPQASSDLGDPYEVECRETAQALAEALGLTDDQWVMSFQSQFGRDEWLKPYTLPLAEELARSGVKRLDVVCPGFAADCLETIEEIDDELREAFLAARSEGDEGQFRYIPALNASTEAIDAYVKIIERELWSDKA